MQLCCPSSRQTCTRRQLSHIDSLCDLLGLLICLLLLLLSFLLLLLSENLLFLLRLLFHLIFFQHAFFFLGVGELHHRWLGNKVWRTK